ncbi:MAG: TRAP transporter fused permease subunit [Alphaproteobacteria bacterium]|nr:MAG: TRAP transporter fused permease subunit [Alphaproteobacteria bacterium]
MSPTESAENVSQARSAISVQLAQWLGFSLVVVVLGFAFEIPALLEWPVLTEQGIALVLGFGLAVVFLKRRASGGSQTHVPFYDIIAAFLSLVIGFWLAIRFPIISGSTFDYRDEAFALSLITIPLVFEALRRTAGWALLAILSCFMLYGLFGDIIPGNLQAQTMGFYRTFAYLVGDNVGLLGLPLTILVTIVVMFVVFGELLLRSGGSQWFTDLAMSVMGHRRGGPAKVAILASALFGSVSGSAVANVASTGVVTIPLMKRTGYKPVSAAAYEAVASTGGQIMPPIMGAAAFLMAELLEVEYAEVILAALIPAFLYYVSVFVQADLEAARRDIPPISKDELEPLGKVVAKGWIFVLPFAVLIGAIFMFNRTPSEAAAWASTMLLVVSMKGYKGHRLSFPVVIDSLKNAGQTSTGIIVIGAMAGLIIGVVEFTGLGFGLTFTLVQIGENSLILLLVLTAFVSIILGMGMPTTAIYFLVAILAAPPLIKLGVDPFAAHLFVLYYGLLSLITPPVAVAAFTAANLAGARPMETAALAVKFAWPAFALPFVFVFSPELLLKGEALAIVWAVIAATVGVWITSAGLAGYLMRRLDMLSRGMLVVAGLALLFPGKYIGEGWIDLAGLGLVALFLGRDFLINRRTA